MPVRNDFEVFQGIVTGNNDVFLPSNEKIQEDKLEKELIYPVLLGRDFEKWYVRNMNRRILYINSETKIWRYPNVYKHELEAARSSEEKSTPWYCLHRPRDKNMLDIVPKIMVQGTRNPRLETRIIAALDEIGIYGTQGVNFVVPKNKSSSVYFLIAVLNSSLVNFLFKTKFLNVAIKAEYLKDIRIPDVPGKQKLILEEFVNRILAITKDEDYLQNSAKQAQVKTLEQEIDQLVYKLYGLTDEEIRIVEGKSYN